MFPVQDKTTTGTKYAGRSRAVVVDNKDPQMRGRIRVQHPLIGETVWINYLKLPGVFDFPEEGDVVYIEADCGFETHPIAWGNIVMGDEGDPQIPEEFQRFIPTNRGFYTPGGHLVELDDGDGITGLGSKIKITASNGAIINIDSDSDAIDITSKFGDTLSVSAQEGIQASTPSGTALSMKNREVTVTAGESTIVMDDTSITASDAVGGELKIDSGKVALGGPTAELLDLLDQAFQALSTQTAPGFGSPTSTVATFAQLAIQLQTIKGSL